MLQAQDVVKTYGDYTALNNINLDIPEGSIYGLLGPNGAGKTSFIRIVNQITMPDSGQILFNGKRMTAKDVQKIGYLPEERGLYKKMEVGEQALYLAQLKGMTGKEAKQELKNWFEKFDIRDWWNKKIEELSKGMAQKVQFIVTVVHRPKLLIFDEPFTGFDPINTNLIKDEIKQLNKDGATIIFSTHRMESVEELCDHIALINKSEKILEGKLNTIRNDYRSNTYRVGFREEVGDLSTTLPPDVELLKTEREDDLVELTFKLAEHLQPNDLFRLVSTQHQVYHFEEVIPSVNDIFIQNVQST
jgi:ABC-2 type transport system ATP-binding protein